MPPHTLKTAADNLHAQIKHSGKIWKDQEMRDDAMPRDAAGARRKCEEDLALFPKLSLW